VIPRNVHRIGSTDVRARWGISLLTLVVALTAIPTAADYQYILVNRVPGRVWNQNRPETFTEESFAELHRRCPGPKSGRIRFGVGFIFSFLNGEPDIVAESLRRFLAGAQQTDTPVIVQFDAENWWGHRSDLWNFWDPSRPGYDPRNRYNVEWTSWSPDDAVKVCWRNWGRQIRVLPQPNLMSPDYLAACREGLARLAPIVMDWYHALPADKKDLFVGIKVGHESSIGVNAWHYPDGNRLLNAPVSEDPTCGLDHNRRPSRGVAAIGYAAVKTAGIRASGELTEADVAEVVCRYVTILCRTAVEAGVPRDRLFTHGAGWHEGELLYDAAVNAHSCPGWSFYRHAADPRRDTGVQRNLSRTDAPYWAAVEWLLPGTRDRTTWRHALAATLADPKCRYLCIYNWEGIQDSTSILSAITVTLSTASTP